MISPHSRPVRPERIPHGNAPQTAREQDRELVISLREAPRLLGELPLALEGAPDHVKHEVITQLPQLPGVTGEGVLRQAGEVCDQRMAAHLVLLDCHEGRAIPPEVPEENIDPATALDA